MVNINKIYKAGKEAFGKAVDPVDEYLKKVGDKSYFDFDDFEFFKFLEDKKIASKKKKADRAKERNKIKKSQKKTLSNLTDEKKKQLGIITAAEIPYVTLDDGVQAMTKKQAKEQQLREVRKKRYDQAVENLGIESLIRDTPVNPMEINPTKIIDPITNDVISYSGFQNTGDNLILKKDTGLMTTPTNTTPEAMAEFQVMSHAFRGMAMRDPYAAVKLYNKDPAMLDMLSSARNKYKSGMKDLLDQKEQILNDPKMNADLQQIAKKLYPGMDETQVYKSMLDLSHIFPFTETGKLYPGSKFLKEGGNPEYMYLAPSAVNRKVQTFIESRMRNAIDNMKGPQASELSDKVADTVKKADDLLTKLKSLSVLPINKTKNLYAGDKRLIGNPEAVKLTRQDYRELFDYILEMNSIDDLMGKPFNKFADGGEVEVDEETGMMDYLSDKMTAVEDGFQNKIDEELDGNPMRAVPLAISNALKLPGQFVDFATGMTDYYDTIVDEIGSQEAADSVAPAGTSEAADKSEKVSIQEAKDNFKNYVAENSASTFKTYTQPSVALAATFDFFTEPLQEGYADMFTDEDTLSIPFSSFFTEDGQPISTKTDTAFKKILGAGATIGLTGLELLSVISPSKLTAIKNLSPDKLTSYLQKAANFALPLIGFTTIYSTKNERLSDEELAEINRIKEEAHQQAMEEVDDQKRKEQEDLGVSQNPILNQADGGLVGDYLEVGSIPNTTGFAYGGDATPGPFAESMQTGLEEEIDIQDLDLGPAYEGFEDLDIFEEAERGGNQPVEVALNLNKVVGNVPKWVKQGKERVKMYMDNLLPGDNTPRTGTDVAIVDDVVENVTPLTRSEPGQIFYHQMEAELERGPKVYNSSKEVYDFLNARGIGKVEVIDSEIKPMLEKLEGMGQPITREMLLGVVRESPIRNVKSGGYGFLSDTLDGEMRSLNYSGYKEKGAIPNTDRERVLYVDPQDLRGDTGNLPSSVSTHSFKEPYVIAWSRLSDRELGGAFTGKTTTFADEIQSDIFQASQRVAGKLAAKMRHMTDQGIPFDQIQNDLQRDMMQYFKDKGSVFRESMPSASALKVEYDKLVSLQNQLRELSRTPVPEITDEMLTAARGVEAQQTAILDDLVNKFNLELNKQLFPNLPFKLRDQWADASIKRDIYEAAYRKFVLKDPNATDYYAVTPAKLVTKRYGHDGSTRTPQADRIADKKERLERWVRGGMEGDIPNSQYPGVGMYEFYGGPGTDVRTEGGKHFTSSMEKTLKRIAKENNVKVEVLPVKIGDDAKDVWNVVNKETGEILGTGDTARQADAIANDLLLQGMKIKVDRTKQFDTAPSFGVELTPSMAEAFKAYMASGGYVADEEIVGAYGD